VTFRNCHADGSGGAIAGDGNVTIRRSQFESNSAGVSGGAFSQNEGFVYIEDSTFTGNSSAGSPTSGGAVALFNLTGLVIVRNTFFDNEAAGNGGAVFLGGNNLPNVSHNTIIANTADSDGDDIGNGGGLYMQSSTLDMRNNVIAGNLDLSTTLVNPDLTFGGGAVVNHEGNNFVGVNAGAALVFPEGYPNGDNDYVGTADNPLDPMLEAFGSYGGPTDTMPPTPQSPLVDLGVCNAQVADQRGFSNPDTGMRVIDNPPPNANDGCDIGSVELALIVLPHSFEDGFED
jgi:predicted outer membrane repeat protein